jgi:hypothetical protein
MIWAICLIFVFLWIVGMVAQIGGSYIHALLGVALMLALLNFWMGKSKRVRAS